MMMTRERESERSFLSLVVLLFAATASLTIAWCASMPAMVEMSMPGGWSLSMIWMRMPGQSWPGAAAAFVGRWTVMMVAMMLPSLVPVLLRYRQGLASAGTPRLEPTALLVVGYFFIWALLGAALFLVGATLAAVEMRTAIVARAVPVVGTAMVLIAAALHITRWMSRRRAFCREARLRSLSALAVAGSATAAAWRHGLRLGLDCAYCCSSPMVILLVVGLMDLRAMAAVTALITVERLLPDRLRPLVSGYVRHAFCYRYMTGRRQPRAKDNQETKEDTWRRESRPGASSRMPRRRRTPISG